MTHLKNIKITLFIFSLFVAFAACKSNTKTETRDIQLLADSSAYNNNTFSDTTRLKEADAIPPKGTVRSNHTNPQGTKSAGSNSTSSGTTSSGNSSSAGTVSNSGSSTTTTTQKKGWSKAAQGAVIGGVTGAVGGAIISKKKGTGAAVGAAVGAAGGYIIGRQKDKKDGRVQ